MPSPAPVVGDKSLKTQSQVSFMSVEAMEMDPAPASVTSPVKRNHELRQHYESSPSQILSSLQTVLSVSLLGSGEAGSPPNVISLCPLSSPTMWPPWTWRAPC